MTDKTDPALVVFSPKFGVMSANPFAREVLGPVLNPGGDCPLDRIFVDEDIAPAESAAAESLQRGRSCQGNFGFLRSGSGDPLLCEYATHPLFRGSRQIIGVILCINLVGSDAEGPSPAAGSGLPFLPRLDYRALYERLPQGVFSVDTSGRITSFNREAENVTGFSESRVIGKPCREVLRTDRCRTGCPLSQVLSSGTPSSDQEVSLVDRGGAQRTLIVNIHPLRSASGKITGAVEVFRAVAPAPMPGRAVAGAQDPAGMIGEGPKMRALFSKIPDIAASNAAVLICGETGTGKDLLARALHRMSADAGGPFVAVSCSALAESLLESELFGHEKGAFTGAEAAKPGRLELAKGGTLFLDEIGELRAGLQAKLLRVVETRSFERVGGNRSIPLQARLISATHRDLKAAMGEGRFREDLFYRLRTVCLVLPPLRDRIEDIPALVSHFIRLFNRRYKKDVRALDPKVMRFFRQYHWPGNVRELERVIEHAFVFVKGPVIFASHLPDMAEFSPSGLPPLGKGPGAPPDKGPPDRDAVLWALACTEGRRQEAAALLGVSRTSLWRRMKALDLL